MSAPKFGLDDQAISRMAGKLAQRAPVPALKKAEEPMLRFASYDQAVTGLTNGQFEHIGSAIYKRGHSLWQLSKTSEGYSLMRVASEPDVFEEDKTQEAPGLHSEETLKMGARDRYGVQVCAGDLVHYSLGGEPVAGRVVRAAYGYLDVRLDGQIDSGVPADMVMVDRHLRVASGSGEDPSIGIERDSPIHDTDASDKEQMNMHINPEKAAAFVEQHFGSYGATLADMIDRPLGRETIEQINKLAQASKSCECQGKGCEQCMGRQATRVASWASLQKFAPLDVLQGIHQSIAAGLTSRRASKALDIPFALAYELREDIAPIPTSEARSIFAMAKNVRTASAGDVAFNALSGRLGSEFATHIASQVLAFRNQSLGFQRRAVDQTAEDYWKAYFGEYGEQWVREIKRRVKADLVRVALVKQGVDETAAAYWSDYFGDYGEKLVEEVDRATKKKKTVTASRPMNADATPMPLPQPVPRRDIFAGAHIIADESWEGNRVAIAKTASGAFQVLIRSGNAQKAVTARSQQEAIVAFRKAVYAHCGI